MNDSLAECQDNKLSAPLCTCCPTAVRWVFAAPLPQRHSKLTAS